MSGLIFLAALLAMIVLIIITIIAFIKRRPLKIKLLTMAAIIVGYVLAWLFCFTQAKLVNVPMGTDICFDDWCATVTKADRLTDGSIIILHVTMSNHARGIAQKPDDPRIQLIDIQGNHYFATANGKIPLDTRLQLHESLQTTLTFVVPKNAKGIKALIEEGPFITALLFPVDQQVISVEN